MIAKKTTFLGLFMALSITIFSHPYEFKIGHVDVLDLLGYWGRATRTA